MPQALLAFVGEVGAILISGTIAVFGETAAIFLLDVGAKLAGVALLGHLANKLVDIPDLTKSAVSNLITTRSTLEHQRIIYGEALVSGPLWYMNTAGSNNQSLHHAVVVAGHEVEDMTDMWLDDIRIPEAAIDWAGTGPSGVVGAVDSGDFRGDTSLATTTYFRKFLGTDSQAASNMLGSAFLEINSSHMGKGIAYFVARNDFFEGQTQVWSKGAPNAFKALVKGKKVYDPRSDSTQSFGTGPHRLASSGTWEWSDNPALCWADYMIDDQLGFGEDSARIDYGYVASAAELNEEIVFIPTAVETDQRFRCNGTLSTGNTHEANLQSILSSANMTMALVQGQWKLRGWGYETPTLQFNDDHLRDDIQIKLSTEERQRYNTVRGIFVDKDRLYQPHPFPSFTSSEYVARDNSETLIRDIQLPMTNDVYMAQRLAAGVLEQSDLQRTVIYPSNFRTLPVEIGGTIALSNTKMGWTDDTFRVTNYKITDMGGVDLVLQEDNSAAYTDVATDEYVISSGGTITLNDPGVPAPASLWVAGRTNGNHLYVTPPPARLHDWIRFYAADTTSWTDAVQIAEVRGDNYVHRLERPKTQYYWARAVNYAGKESDRIPNSDFTAITTNPDELATRFDPTFDLSDNIGDYWTDFGDGTEIFITNSAGENNEHSCRFDFPGVLTGGLGAIYSVSKMPMPSESVSIGVRYNVRSFSGIDSAFIVMHMGMRCYYPTPVDSDAYQTKPSAYTFVENVTSYATLNTDLTIDGNWHTYETTISLTNVQSKGASLASPILYFQSSDFPSPSNSVYLLADLNWLNWNFK